MIQLQNGHRVFAASYGNEEDPVVLLVHDIGRKHHIWDEQIQFLLHEGYRVIITDLLGHGRSERVRKLEMEDWHNQIIDVMNFYMVNEVVLVTMLSSYMVGESLVTKHPKRFKQVINLLPVTKTNFRLMRWKMLIKEKVKNGSEALEALQERLAIRALDHFNGVAEPPQDENIVHISKNRSGDLAINHQWQQSQINKNIHQWLRINGKRINAIILQGIDGYEKIN